MNKHKESNIIALLLYCFHFEKGTWAYMKRNKDKLIMLILCAILLITAGAFAIVIKSQKDAANAVLRDAQGTTTEYPETSASTTAEPADDFLSAAALLDDITVGYNVGNSLDSCPSTGRNDGTYDTTYFETCWGNPVITEDYIDAISAAGFNAIRLPVTWYYNTYTENGTLKIREDWMDRVTEVVDYALANDMYVILDSHHDEFIVWADMNDIDEVSANVSDLWGQIAEHFKDYDERLVFESFNEINTRDNSWKYNDDSAKATNILNQLFVDTVRASGGKNSERILICDTYLSETSEDVLESFVLPKDEATDKLAISVHSYNSSYNQDIKSFFETLQQFSKKVGVPVTITEFGTTTSFVPSEYRSNHAGNYIACANEYDIKCFWWDDGSNYKLFDRNTNDVLYEDIIDSLMNPAEFKTKKISTNVFDSIESYSYVSISSQTGALESFANGALTLNLGNQGLPVIFGYGYRIVLNATGEADGLRLSGLAFYDSHQNLVKYQSINQALSYDISPPADASFMRICFYNPWGYRSLDEYMSYLENQELSLEVTEYIK